jgi:DNA-directed RNA polymerase specialized sigma subunit
VEETDEGQELWEVIGRLLPNEREQRLAHLLFHCGLKAREIVRHCPGEFSDVREVYQLRRTLLERLRRNADQIRWRLSSNEYRF